MRIGDKQRGDHVIFFCGHARHTFTAPSLGPVIGQRGAFDIATGGNRHDHVFPLDQVFVVHVAGPFHDLGAAWYGVIFPHFLQFVGDDRQDPLPGSENVEIVPDFLCQFFQLVRDFLDT